MRDQVKRINIYLLSLFVFLIFFNVYSFSIHITYSQNEEDPPVGTDTEITDSKTPVRDKVEEKKQNVLDYIFDNSVTTMLLSTFIIAIIGTLISKMRNLKKKLDMIEILTKSQIKMKQQAAEKDKVFEERFIQSQKLVSEQIDKLCQKMDRKTEELQDKIDNVERTATSTLIKYLSENSFDRKR